MKIKLMFNCNEATHVCDKAQYSEASFWLNTSKVSQFILQIMQRNTLKEMFDLQIQ